MKAQIVFTGPGSFWGKIVRAMVGGNFTHIHFLIISNRNTWTYEAFPPRVRLVNQDLYPGQGEVFDLPFTHDQCERLLDEAITVSQKSIYGLEDAFRIFVRNRISKKLASWLSGKWQDSHTETCTTLIIKTIRLFDPDFGGKDALEFCPDEVYEVFKTFLEKQE